MITVNAAGKNVPMNALKIVGNFIRKRLFE